MVDTEIKSEENSILDFSSEETAFIDLVLEKHCHTEGKDVGLNVFRGNDMNFDEIKNKPWTMAGSDITDYFNYGFNEKTYQHFLNYQNERKNFLRRYENDYSQPNGSTQPQHHYDKLSNPDHRSREDTSSYKRDSHQYYGKNEIRGQNNHRQRRKYTESYHHNSHTAKRTEEMEDTYRRGNAEVKDSSCSNARSNHEGHDFSNNTREDYDSYMRNRRK